mmetsp:Transcript_40239/g.127230  ORF Transcript_40239/g.127230 Transcript_40239/m.127230 type:complete len:481 (-) Transcript_40239:176-1618(-)
MQLACCVRHRVDGAHRRARHDLRDLLLGPRWLLPILSGPVHVAQHLLELLARVLLERPSRLGLRLRVDVRDLQLLAELAVEEEDELERLVGMQRAGQQAAVLQELDRVVVARDVPLEHDEDGARSFDALPDLAHAAWVGVVVPGQVDEATAALEDRRGDEELNRLRDHPLEPLIIVHRLEHLVDLLAVVVQRPALAAVQRVGRARQLEHRVADLDLAPAFGQLVGRRQLVRQLWQIGCLALRHLEERVPRLLELVLLLLVLDVLGVVVAELAPDRHEQERLLLQLGNGVLAHEHVHAAAVAHKRVDRGGGVVVTARRQQEVRLLEARPHVPGALGVRAEVVLQLRDVGARLCRRRVVVFENHDLGALGRQQCLVGDELHESRRVGLGGGEQLVDRLEHVALVEARLVRVVVLERVVDGDVDERALADAVVAEAHRVEACAVHEAAPVAFERLGVGREVELLRDVLLAPPLRLADGGDRVL